MVRAGAGPRIRRLSPVHDVPWQTKGGDLRVDREQLSRVGRHAVPFIPPNRACIIGTEFGYTPRAIDVMHISGDGPFMKKCSGLIINDPQYTDRAQAIGEKGSTHSRFFLGQRDGHTSADLGPGGRPSDILAAFLCAPSEPRGGIHPMRPRVCGYHFENPHGRAKRRSVRLPAVLRSHREQPNPLLHLLLPSLELRQAFAPHLKASDILAASHYLTLHLPEMGQRFVGKHGDCAVTNDVGHRQVHLPFRHSLTIDDQVRVVISVR
jgi:dTDP-4-amino-4,6-dideoxygalactose transaminase